MPKMPVDLELERLKNLITGFGWEIESKEITTDKITVTVTKQITARE